MIKQVLTAMIALCLLSVTVFAVPSQESVEVCNETFYKSEQEYVDNASLLASSGTCGTNLKWKIDNSGTLTISGRGSMESWYYTSSIPWYSSSNSIKSIVIEDGVTSIGNRAFYNCQNLVNINIPKTIKSIGSDAFKYCVNLEVVNIDSIDYWYDIVFQNELSNPIAYAHKLYINGDAISELIIPGSITTINSYAFYNFQNLSRIKVSESVTSVGNSAFYGCTNLNSVHITNLDKWCNIDFYDYYSNPLYYANNLFIDNSSVSDIIIPDTVTDIKSYTFCHFTSMKSITIPSSVKTIGKYVFSGCTNLEKIYLPNNSITKIDDRAFSNCTGINSVYITDIASWCNIDFYNYESNPLYYAEYLFINNISVKDIILPDSVSKIEDYAFYNFNGIESITIADSVKSIGYMSFSSCDNLTKVKETGSVENIGTDAFSYCENLVIYGESGSDISTYANENDIKFIAILGTCGNNLNWCFDENNTLTIYGYGEMSFSTQFWNTPWQSLNRIIETVVIEEGASSIGAYMFQGCGLTSIYIPCSMEKIDLDAFSGCSNLTNVFYRGTKEEWENVSIYSENEKFANANIYYGKYCIYYNPNGGYNVPSMQYANSGEITNLTTEEPSREGCKFHGWSTTANGIVEYLPGADFKHFEDIVLYAVWFPDVSGTCGFNLKWHLYGSKLTIIGTGSMSNWSESTLVPWSAYKNEIETVVISDGATSIGSYAFSDCENLKTVTFTESVTKINSHAFDNAAATETINYTGSLEDLENIEISDYNDSFMNASFVPDYIIVYQINYNSNGGNLVPEAQSKNHNIALTLSSIIPIKFGHAFKGWSTIPNGEVVYNAGDEYTENADIVLYAIWEKVMGDASGDGKLTSEDIDLVAAYLTGATLTSEQLEFANIHEDYDGNGNPIINIKDLIALAQKI